MSSQADDYTSFPNKELKHTSISFYITHSQVLESLGRVKEWVFKAPSRVAKVAGGEGVPGTRAAPTQSGTNDTAIGGRIDYCETITKDGKQYRPRLILRSEAAPQANSRRSRLPICGQIWRRDRLNMLFPCGRERFFRLIVEK